MCVGGSYYTLVPGADPGCGWGGPNSGQPNFADVVQWSHVSEASL